MKAIYHLLVVMVFLLMGCVGQPSGWATRLGELQTFSDRIATSYGVSTLRIEMSGGYGGGWANYFKYPIPKIGLHPDALGDTVSLLSLKRLVAHEWGHHLLNHSSQNPDQEIAADIKGIEILQRVEGMSDR